MTEPVAPQEQYGPQPVTQQPYTQQPYTQQPYEQQPYEQQPYGQRGPFEQEPFPAAPELVEPEPVWNRLDLRMLVVRPLNEAVGLIPLILGLLVYGTRNIWQTVSGIAAVVLLVSVGLVHWLTTKYRITGDQVQLHKGLFVRKQFSVPRDRIRTVDLTAKLGHRLFGLSAIRIGTGEKAHTQHHELTLDAVSSAEAERLRQVLLRKVAPSTRQSEVDDSAPVDVEETPGTVLAQLKPGWLRYAPLTLSGLVAVGAAFGILMNFARELNLDPGHYGRDTVRWLADAPVGLIVGIIAGVVLVAAVFGSLIVYVFQFWGYRLTRETDGTVRVRRGLLTTRSVSVEEKRLRGVEVQQPLLLRAGRGARVKAVTTGLSHHREGSLLLPPAPAAEAHRVSAEVLGVSASPTTAPLVRHPRRALWRRLVRAVLPVLVIAGALGGLASLGQLPSWPWQVALCLVPFAALLGVDRYRNLGHALTDHYLVSRNGSVVRETVALQRTGIIGWRISQSVFQRRAGLVTVAATTAAGTGAYHVLDVAEDDGLALAEAAVPDLLRPFLVR
ncbi:PH domain-containing protein [Solihabitans fulvus]|uniref:PH domain-containing protein n=1 Tax=Solihabitans fulvus TaxID=1892852 RepID=A0A5B2XDK7_9PSEU|nr:PH domain-containing protein [Solihabitans fulvus]KAA2261306.1 PH domain-containing protein [Solihabitans fulvus]